MRKDKSHEWLFALVSRLVLAYRSPPARGVADPEVAWRQRAQLEKARARAEDYPERVTHSCT